MKVTGKGQPHPQETGRLVGEKEPEGGYGRMCEGFGKGAGLGGW